MLKPQPDVTMSWSIRRANEADADMLAEIWLAGTPHAGGNDQEDPGISMAEAKAFMLGRIRLPGPEFGVWVGVADDDETILGWQSLRPLSDHPLVRYCSAESSTYVNEGVAPRGVGPRLVEHVVLGATRTRLEHIVAFIHPDNAGVLKVAAKVGFVRVGPLPALKWRPAPEFEIYAYPVGR